LGLSTDDSNYDEVNTSLTDYLMPKRNREFERYEFRNIKQQTNESVDQFSTRLRQKAETCEFSNKEDEIKSQIIQGCTSRKLRIKCLQEDKSLPDILVLARTMEIADRQSKIMAQSPEIPVNNVRHAQHKPYTMFNKKLSHKSQPDLQRTKKECRNCGGDFPHQSQCPAFGKTFKCCHKRNHFIKECRKK
jgi:hypothetical protein